MRERRDSFYLTISPIDAPETAVLIAIHSMNIHQYDPSYCLVPHVPSSLATGRTYLYHTSRWSNTSDIPSPASQFSPTWPIVLPAWDNHLPWSGQTYLPAQAILLSLPAQAILFSLQTNPSPRPSYTYSLPWRILPLSQ